MTSKRAQLLALATKCEEATGPSRELDEEIAACLAGAILEVQTGGRKAYHKDGFWVSIEPILKWSESVDAALTLVPKGLGWSYGTHLGKSSHEGVYPAAYVDGIEGRAATPALALCAAALRALASMEPDDVPTT